MMKLLKSIPILHQLGTYSRRTFNKDLAAGMTVGIMLIPQGMAYAMIAGLPPIYGLYASTIPLFLYAILGTSRQLAVGPVAMVALLTAAGVGAIAESGTANYIELTITLALLVGVIQLLMGALRLGFLVNFLSHPVISGFTSAAALIIGLSQLKHLLGVEISRSHHIHEILFQAFDQIDQINWATVAIGFGGILLIVGVKKLHRSIPGALLALLFGVLAVSYLGGAEQGVKTIGQIPEGLPAFTFPGLALEHWAQLLPVAMTIALIGFTESIAVAKAVQAKHRDYKLVPNQELVALGVANIGGAFFQSFPVTGGLSRTAVNDQSGAQTGMASVISGLVVVLTLLFLTPLFYHLPFSILAALIMVAVFGLIDWKEVLHLWKSDRVDFGMLLATFIATLALGVEQGIGIGVLLSIGMMIFRSTHPHVAVLGKVPGSSFYRNVDRFQQISERDDLLILRFDAQLYFANVDFFKTTIEKQLLRKGAMLKALIIDMQSINSVDSTAIHAIQEVWEDCQRQEIRLYFSGVKGPVRDAMCKAELMQPTNQSHFVMDIQEAVDDHDQALQQAVDSLQFQSYTLQTNT